MIEHHLPENFLLDYAAGSLAEPESVVVASHLSMCGTCNERVELLESVAGNLLDEEESVSLDFGAFDTVLQKIDLSDDEPASESVKTLNADTRKIIPPPLRDYLEHDLDELSWRFIGSGIREAILVKDGESRLSLIKIRPGGKVPTHTHEGEEFTLILHGAYTDGERRFAKGDLAIADENVDHAPVVDGDEYCLCLALFKGPVRMTGPIGRLMNPLIRG